MLAISIFIIKRWWCYLIRIAFCLLLITFFLSLPIVSDDAESLGPNHTQIKPAVEKGLAWLASQQNENGSWTCRVGYKLNENYIGREYDNVCVTALAGMAYLANGNLPGRGKYGKNVTKAVEFVLACVRESDGYITKHGTRMYEHAFATLFLAEIYGMSPRTDIKTKLKKAVHLIIQAQNKEGGWRYQPAPIDADISVTVSTLQTLRAARNVGLAVPIEVINKAEHYVRKCARPNGSFAYQLSPGSRDKRPALAAAGVTSLMSIGDYSSPEIQRGLRYLINNFTNTQKLRYHQYHYFYAHYYMAQVMYQAGGHYWERYFPRVYNEILTHQQEDGSWRDDVGPSYATAMACIILQIPLEYLPIFQR